MNIPAPTENGAESTIVVDRILLADPTGKIPEKALKEFMEIHVEPAFWGWMQKRKEAEHAREKASSL